MVWSSTDGSVIVRRLDRLAIGEESRLSITTRLHVERLRGPYPRRLRTIADLRWTVLDESVIVGLPAAVFAAMFNATPKRVTDLAITRQRRLWRYALIQ